MNLTNKQVKKLVDGGVAIAELNEENREKKKGIGDKKLFNGKKGKSKPIDSTESFYQLLAIPGMKMTEKARQKFLENKQRVNNAS